MLRARRDLLRAWLGKEIIILTTKKGTKEEKDWFAKGRLEGVGEMV